MKKDIVCGLGEIGLPIYKIFSKVFPVEGYDINSNLIPKSRNNLDLHSVRFLHICIPFNKNFNHNVIKLVQKFSPESIVIHSTIKPGTTDFLQKKLKIPIIFSATRGVHKRMKNDLKKYTKFFAIVNNNSNSRNASHNFSQLLKKSKIKSKRMSNPITLELAKIICDTSYYGWLINYAQMSKIIAQKFNVDYDEMWSFSDEIHEYLGNRPKMFPGFIGGHCVIPNLKLMNDSSLNQINDINKMFEKFLKK